MDKNRLFWASRRGMLELDLILLPFIEQIYPELDAEDQARYHRLLDCEDQDLFGWFLRRQDPEDPELLKIVRIVRDTRHRVR
ncbi:MAG: succinate dehydrogenase assembly factor 2 [Porticoccaceae bacterium]|jgi:antitoxin CptB|nr:succinate dehydrogenase assembly factor 2 [Porticoccaceae bacterium]MEA3299791.1 succinate dehydrogenase assembly factor 2 [Pseudomonadota bacterium]HLS98936.1 succinate dehydrogenase assembly factor 2 [Porticoccaceae bacterium]